MCIITIKESHNTPTKRGSEMNEYTTNQIVKGKVAGMFVILGFRMIGGEEYAQLKEVNPNNHAQTAPGEIALPLNAIEAI